MRVFSACLAPRPRLSTTEPPIGYISALKYLNSHILPILSSFLKAFCATRGRVAFPCLQTADRPTGNCHQTDRPELPVGLGGLKVVWVGKFLGLLLVGFTLHVPAPLLWIPPAYLISDSWAQA